VKIPNPTGLISLGKAFIQANRPELLLGASIVSTVSGVILAARGGYKSGQQVLQQEIDTKTEMTTREKAKLTWINYLPAAASPRVRSVPRPVCTTCTSRRRSSSLRWL
jgi:hypothetical protein